MEKWGKERPQRRGHEYPSFSSTLLDAIYRSIDESDAGAAAAAAALDTPPIAFVAARRPAPAYHSASAPPKERPVPRPARRLPPISTSSSSDNSSYGGFSSSSEPESAASHHRGRIRPIHTLSAAPARSAPRPLPPPPPPPPPRAPSPPPAARHHQEKKSKSSSIRSKLCDLGRSRAPASPGARLASLLNSIFATAAGRPRKPKVPPAAAVDDSACSTASSYSRSCLVKTPSSRRGLPPEDEGVKRSVRFHPVSVIVGEDLRPCGQKIVYAGDRCAAAGARAAAAAAAAEEEDRRRRSTAAEGKGREEARRRVEELLRRYADEAEDEEDEDEMSDSSSDLFELENLSAVGGGCGGGSYRDELPVYGTTHPGTNRAISRGLVQ